MMPADFYLASSEGYEMDCPRRCRAIKRLRGDDRDDYLLISIDPPLSGQVFGLGGRDIDQAIVATRHQGESLFPIKRWPVFVHVARLLVPYEGQEAVRNDEVEAIAWAELYATEEAAWAKEM
jgi:hypothetical protein